MSKIQKQRDEFVSSIDTSDWDQYSQSDIYYPDWDKIESESTDLLNNENNKNQFLPSSYA